MTQIEFQLLSDEEKIDVLYEHGVYIGKQKLANRSVLLYQLEGFYVEVFYSKHRQSVQKIYCFSSTNHLDPYLEQIDVVFMI